MVFLIISILAVAVLAALYFSTERFSQFGARAEGARLEQMKKSPNFDGNVFINPVATNLDWESGGFFPMMRKWIFGKEKRNPEMEIEVVKLNPEMFNQLPDGLRVTWLGHSTALLEIDGVRILTDPVWSERCSPSSLWGPARFHRPPLALKDLPAINAVIISHDHYDHLDKKAVCALAESGVRFYVPLGIGAHLERWGIISAQIKELDWWDESTITGDGVRLIATPARHFSGRRPSGDRNTTLWVSFVIVGPGHRVFFSGDTGNFPGLAEIGGKYGPFDLTLIKIAAYGDQWPDIHLNPEQAVQAHISLKGDLLLPIHWGTFNLAFHDWYEPPDWFMEEAKKNNLSFVMPRPGQIVSISDPPRAERWWEEYK